MEILALFKEFQANQKRWPKGSPLGGQWRGSGGLTRYVQQTYKGMAAFEKSWLGDKTSDELLGKANRQAAWDYTNGLSSYINAHLRGVTPPHQLRSYTAQDALDAIVGMDVAIAKHPVLPTDSMLWKGISTSLFKGVGFGQGLVGKSFRDMGFASTSFFKAQAEIFRSGGLMRLLARKGTRGVYVNPFSSLRGKNDEYEFILSRGSHFLITAYETYSNGVPLVTAILLP